MISDADLFIIAQINSGLRTNIAHLHDLDEQMTSLLRDARSFPNATSPARVTEWDELMSDVETLQRHARRIDETLLDKDSVADPKDDWAVIEEAGQRIEHRLARLRDGGLASIAPERRHHWDDLWRTVFLHFETVRAYAAVVQAKGEMRARYGAGKMDGVEQDILKHLPTDIDLGHAERYAEEYRKGIEEHLFNKEHVGGFRDIVKALLMIPEETPDQIARRRMNNMRRD